MSVLQAVGSAGDGLICDCHTSLHNQLKEETSLHWHGIILPNPFDGVPFLTTKPIHPGDVYGYDRSIVFVERLIKS